MIAKDQETSDFSKLDIPGFEEQWVNHWKQLLRAAEVCSLARYGGITGLPFD